MTRSSPVVVRLPEARRSPESRIKGQAERIAALLGEIEQAFRAEDFGRLAQLGNRLATDSVIAQALKDRGLDRNEAV